MCWVRVALDVPLARPVRLPQRRARFRAGLRVIVPFGRRKMIGVVVEQPRRAVFRAKQIRPIEAVLDDLPPFDEAWLRMARFAADYYQRPLGRGDAARAAAAAAQAHVLPGQAVRRRGRGAQLDARKRKAARARQRHDQPPALNDAQEAAVQAIARAAAASSRCCCTA